MRFCQRIARRVPSPTAGSRLMAGYAISPPERAEFSVLQSAQPESPAQPNGLRDKRRKLEQSCDPSEFAALLYLTLPLVVFFAFFTKLWIAVPALVTILAVLYRVRSRSH